MTLRMPLRPSARGEPIKPYSVDIAVSSLFVVGGDVITLHVVRVNVFARCDVTRGGTDRRAPFKNLPARRDPPCGKLVADSDATRDVNFHSAEIQIIAC